MNNAVGWSLRTAWADTAAVQWLRKRSSTLQSNWNATDDGQHIGEPPAFLWQFFTTAQLNIHLIAQQQCLDPHSTCVAAYLTDKEGWFTHLGDSRLYHFRQNHFLRRTKDHSFVQMLVDLGKISEEDMASHQEQNSLYQGLGGNKNREIELEIKHAQIKQGDGFLRFMQLQQ